MAAVAVEVVMDVLEVGGDRRRCNGSGSGGCVGRPAARR
jgi:hypothetical protein